MPPEHPLRHCAHIDGIDHYAAVPRPVPETFECPKCYKLTKKNICHGGTKADTAWCPDCRIEFAIVPTWHERLMELKAEKPGKILRDDKNFICLTIANTSTACNSNLIYSNLIYIGNTASNTWTIT